MNLKPEIDSTNGVTQLEDSKILRPFCNSTSIYYFVYIKRIYEISSLVVKLNELSSMKKEFVRVSHHCNQSLPKRWRQDGGIGASHPLAPGLIH